MTRGPHDGPLGARPVLPPPTGAGAARAKRVFEGYLARLRDGQSLEALAEAPPAGADEPATAGSWLSPAAITAGRRYDLALSKLGVEAPSVATAEVTVSAARGVEGMPAPATAADEETVADDALPRRPPPGAPAIRPSPPRPQGVAAVPQDLLETAAESALLINEGDASTSFEIAFSDELFADLVCRITVTKGAVVATFIAPDQNLRRLLEAEAPRLAAGLEARGLKVAEIKVELTPETSG